MIATLLATSGWLGHWLREGRKPPVADGILPAQVPVLRDSPDAAVPAAGGHHHASPWYATLWLTGVDYFSSLGYAPGLAVMAAGYVAPLATLLLVGVTFLAALPVYAMVAKHSPNGEGSIKLIERLTSGWGRLGWGSKTLVLSLLGFALTDFVITITLSAADATHHILENPLLQAHVPHRPVLVTALLMLGLCVVFLKGFREAISLAVAIALPYMVLNAVIIAAGLDHLRDHPELVDAWWAKVAQFDVTQLRDQLNRMSKAGAGPVAHLSGGGGALLVAVSLVVFPKLALGLSGFETGVSVMPHVAAPDVARRVRNTRKMMAAAAVLMCIELLGANVVATLVIPEKEYWLATPEHPAGKAAGRALAFLAHDLLGAGFGTVYDLITVLILWFAGASAMAGLLGILPRYLPRFGMSPAWLEFRRPLVLVITTVCLTVNWVFEADVEKQGGAYATGVLVLMASDSFAVMLAEREKSGRAWIFGVILLVFAYVLVVNVAERPDGIKIAGVFILLVIFASLGSRWYRASELRVCGVRYSDPASESLWAELANSGDVVVIPQRTNSAEARRKTGARSLLLGNNGNVRYAFLHVSLLDDPSQFDSPIEIKVTRDEEFYVVEVSNAVAVANAIAFVALRLNARDVIIGLLDSGNSVSNSIMYLVFGTGEVGYAVRAIFVRLREESLQRSFALRAEFDRNRDKQEKELLRDALLLDDTDRAERTAAMFREELQNFEAQVAKAPHMPRLILFDGK
ncbi:MAG: hypothetical protein FJ100_16715 [Deltaproteobacteria bacterium]|nr:hypothetical protein [Deltaproteobacteria bacterium]